MRGFFAAICVIWPAFALAETPAQLQAEGEQLARAQRFTEAIEKFKAADRLEPRASHACLIALAYTRRELWPQAEIFAEKCHQRATPQDPLPDWVTEADAQIKARIAAANVAPVEIVVEPADPQVQLTVSSFAPDESFAPRTIHLPPGHHVIVAITPGRPSTERAIDVVDKTPQHIVIDLREPPATGGAPPAPTGPARQRSRTPYVVGGAGLAIAAIGGVVEATYYNTKRNALIGVDRATYDANSPAYDHARDLVIGLYAVGGAAVITSLVLWAREPREQPALAIAPTAGGGMVSVAWRR